MKIVPYLLLVIGYLIGSIPTGLLIARLKGVANIRDHGSGNTGATNVARVLGIRYFFVVFFIDACKAYGWLWVLQQCTLPMFMQYLGAIIILLGNTCSLFLAGRGGKGVAVSMGIVAFFMPLITCIAMILWAMLFCILRVAGYASVITMVLVPGIAWYITQDVYICSLLGVISVWVLQYHRNYIHALCRPIISMVMLLL